MATESNATHERVNVDTAEAMSAERPALETRPLPAIDMAADAAEPRASHDTDAAPPSPPEHLADSPDETLVRRIVRNEPTGANDAGATPPATSAIARPRKNTLANVITPAQGTRIERGPVTPAPAPIAPERPMQAEPAPPQIVNEIDEWSVADQPTVYLAPRPQTRLRPTAPPPSQPLRPPAPPALPTPLQRPPAPRPTQRPAFLETDERAIWPPRHVPTDSASAPPLDGPPRQAYPVVDEPAPPRRLVSPDGKVAPALPPGAPAAGLPNPRMERFQELRRQRLAHDDGAFAPDDAQSVGGAVRQWWNDLLPGLERALHYQHEAQASGTHPIPAYEAPPTTARLGDAFGRLAASARSFTERAQAAAAPTIKRLHTQAEQAASAIVEKIEGEPARQQAPLLGPGRIAVFFRHGVTMGQAQSLLAASQARPIRLISRKHGFLARVAPGLEAEISERLRQHPYVREVVYLEYDEYGEAIEPR